ncbi:MAG: laccase domain-containing protein [Spirochaetaceae bacterium]|nr:laccase domain-containing protein [Spirochaetaceae bacterium]
MTCTSVSLDAAPRAAGPAALSLEFPLPPGAAPPLAAEPRAYLSLRAEGDMRYRADAANPNRDRFFRALGLWPERVLGLELVHSRSVYFPLEEEAPAGGADGMLLRDPGSAASVTVADCMPIWLLDRESGAFGVLHSGWKGTGILEAAVRLLGERFGSAPASVSVILGPAVGACCYAVPEERAALFAAEFGPETVIREGGSPRLDLRAANLAIAARLGLGALLSVEDCSSCRPELGSYRREGSEAFTRMVALAAYPPATGG